MPEQVILKEQTILVKLVELRELLNLLNATVDYLVRRNPSAVGEEKKPLSQREDNVFDEIMNDLSVCKKLTKEATEKIETSISRKVQ